MLSYILIFLAILLHEFGHFIVAKCFGVRVERFCLFFDPGFCLYSTGKRFSTEFRIGWLPIGGYVRFAAPETEVQPSWSLLAQRPWKRILISLAGVIMNLLIAYGCLFAWIRAYVLPESQYSNVYVMQKAGELSAYSLNTYRYDIVDFYLPEKFQSSDDAADKYSVDFPENNHLREALYTEGDHEQSESEEAYTNRFFPSKWGISRRDLKPNRLLWDFANLNLILFLFNLLPIPPLDGAQCLFSLYEMIFRKPVNEKVQLLLVLAGVLLLFGMLGFDILSDVYHFVKS